VIVTALRFFYRGFSQKTRVKRFPMENQKLLLVKNPSQGFSRKSLMVFHSYEKP
jgi:hypothetical protein